MQIAIKVANIVWGRLRALSQDLNGNHLRSAFAPQECCIFFMHFAHEGCRCIGRRWFDDALQFIGARLWSIRANCLELSLLAGTKDYEVIGARVSQSTSLYLINSIFSPSSVNSSSRSQIGCTAMAM